MSMKTKDNDKKSETFQARPAAEGNLRPPLRYFATLETHCKDER